MGYRSFKHYFSKISGHDLVKGRRTEIDYTYGYVAAMGERAGQQAPAHAALAAMVKRVERGELKRGMHILESFLKGDTWKSAATNTSSS